MHASRYIYTAAQRTKPLNATYSPATQSANAGSAAAGAAEADKALQQLLAMTIPQLAWAAPPPELRSSPSADGETRGCVAGCAVP